jgi:pyruvate/2-oxoglutarate dehydrogenase complex dihydrolipoamide acyltransferase (E2) component
MALVDIVMPKMGESIMDGRILKWYKKPGDTVAKDETLFEISTDKVDTEVPSAEGGVLVEVLFNEGETANVGDVVARIETDAANAKVVADKPQREKKQEDAVTAESNADKVIITNSQTVVSEKTSDGESVFYTPLVLNIARKEGISMDELAGIRGSGAGGRVRKQDLLEYIRTRKSQPTSVADEQQTKPAETKAEPVAKTEITAKKISDYKSPEIRKSPELTHMYNMPGVDVVPMDTLQSKMAEHMVMSVHTSPHVAAIAECDMTNVDRVRKSMYDEFLKKEGFKLTYMPFICEAVVKALKDFPFVNASIDGNNILVKKFINLGIAVAMDNGGLIVPVIKNADSKNLIGLARDLNDLAGRARAKKLTLDEIQDGTFTITNYGIFGNIIGTPIINQPQIAILGTGAIKKRPVVVETSEGDAIVIKPVMYLTLSFDHRLIDGALGGRFLMKVVEYIENYHA